MSETDTPTLGAFCFEDSMLIARLEGKHQATMSLKNNIIKQLERSLASADKRITFLESAEIGQVEADNVRLKQELAEAKDLSENQGITQATLIDLVSELRKQLAEKDAEISRLQGLVERMRNCSNCSVVDRSKCRIGGCVNFNKWEGGE